MPASRCCSRRSNGWARSTTRRSSRNSRTGPFDTVAGKIKLDKNVNTNVWWAGQWQNGEFYGLAPTSMAGAHEAVAPKPAWKPAP